jgi:hypothetical protein
MIDEQPDVEPGPSSCATGSSSRPSCSPRGRPRSSRCCWTSRARAQHGERQPSASSRHARRARRARSRALKRSPRRQTSSARPRWHCRPRAQHTRLRHPSAPTATVFSPSSSPLAAETATIVRERLWVPAPNPIIDLVVLLSCEADTLAASRFRLTPAGGSMKEWRACVAAREPRSPPADGRIARDPGVSTRAQVTPAQDDDRALRLAACPRSHRLDGASSA